MPYNPLVTLFLVCQSDFESVELAKNKLFFFLLNSRNSINVTHTAESYESYD